MVKIILVTYRHACALGVEPCCCLVRGAAVPEANGWAEVWRKACERKPRALQRAFPRTLPIEFSNNISNRYFMSYEVCFQPSFIFSKPHSPPSVCVSVPCFPCCPQIRHARVSGTEGKRRKDDHIVLAVYWFYGFLLAFRSMVVPCFSQR